MRAGLRGEQPLCDRPAIAAEERVQTGRLAQGDSDLNDTPSASSPHTHGCLRIEGRGSLRDGRGLVSRRRDSRGGGRTRGGGAARCCRGRGQRRQGHRHGNDRHGCRDAADDWETVLRRRRCAARECAGDENAGRADRRAGTETRGGNESRSGTGRGHREPILSSRGLRTVVNIGK
jgi:hypothetical protein